jgi:ribosomal protein S18 acetylase RimI-like enzyme
MPASYRVRPLREADYDAVIDLVDGWWGGRLVHPMLPRLFFTHFASTGLAVDDAEGRIAGFLVGFLSPTRPAEAYVHFVGVRPDARRGGVARTLYERFFELAAAEGRELVRCVTSPVNRASVAFHCTLGFEVEPGTGDADGIAFTPRYDGEDGDRVRLVRHLARPQAEVRVEAVQRRRPPG